MSADHRVEPPHVIEMVERFVNDRLRSAQQYSNSEPLDESGIHDLHRLAARIYAAGYEDGEGAYSRRASAAQCRAIQNAHTREE